MTKRKVDSQLLINGWLMTVIDLLNRALDEQDNERLRQARDLVFAVALPEKQLQPDASADAE